jgi:hypothetical protein
MRKADMCIQENHLSAMALIQPFDYHYLVRRKQGRNDSTTIWRERR